MVNVRTYDCSNSRLTRSRAVDSLAPGCLAGLVCGHCALDFADQVLAFQLEGIKDAICLMTSVAIVVVPLLDSILKIADDLFLYSYPTESHVQ